MRWFVLIGLAACGGGGSKDSIDASTVPDAGPVTQPPARCDVPPEGKLVDTSAPTTVVGTGAAGSCTAQALQDAVTKGGIVTFSCGPDPITITLTAPIKINNVAGADQQGDTVIDGGGKVTLSGGGTSRILYLNACEQPFNDPRCDIHPHPHLTVQRLTLTGGHDDGADGGGAIFRVGGALTVIDSVFLDNTCAVTGQDTAGGAIRLMQATPALIVGSTFGEPGHGNHCSDGGAIGSLQASPVTIINSVFDGNGATGTGGNPGNGGNGGAIYHDGVGLSLSLCGVQLKSSTANAYGGGIFYVDDAGQGTISITNTELDGATVPVVSGQPSHGGAAYLQGANVTVANTTITNASAGFAAGVFVFPMNGRGTFDATNLTMTAIAGDALVASDGVTGTLLNATIAGNTRGLTGGGVGGMKLVNTLVAGQSGASCTGAPIDGGGNLQFPGTSCGSITTGDPQLGALADHGGTTGVHTMAPAAGSPALGAGNGCPSTDARGIARPASGCTSGAHQAD
ncbi:MAG TPA: choice-of-anchor Q domain-containing protein [Kofleriaceae bacterium]|nr:choice-of-anchor Q domain-containing protein [Kofleriaceae bacterium]